MENFRKIKDEIVCYNRKDLIACATNYINRVDTDLKEEIFPYWTYLTLIRWSLEYSSDLLILKKFTPENCQDLATKIFNLMEVHDFLNFNLYKGWFFNVLAYQQFRFQRNDFPLVIARSYHIFVETENPQLEKVRTRFEEIKGISIKEFLGMLSVVYFMVSINKLFKWNDFVYGLKFLYGEEKHQKFLQLLELNTKNPEKFLEAAKSSIKNPDFQIYDNEIFFYFPFLYKADNSIVVLNSKILINTAELYLYRFCRNQKINPDIHFGNIFERYVSQCLNDVEIQFNSEKELIKLYPDGKVVDFLIQENVLVECKAVEMKTYVSVFPSPKKLSKEIKNSITKAYVQQMLTIATKIQKTIDKKILFGIILTYRDPFLGRLNDYWDEFLKEEVEKYKLDNPIDATNLPIENVFILSINDFEMLIKICRKYQFQLSEILNKAVVDNRDSSSQKFSFIQHLENFNVGDEEISFLSSAYNKVKEFVNPDRFVLK